MNFNKKIIIRVVSLLIIVLVAVLVSRFFMGPKPEDPIEELSIKEQRELFENFDVFTNINPLSDRLSFEDFKKGFWYKKKDGYNEDIFFFDTPNLIALGLSQAEILELIEKLLEDSIIVKKERIQEVEQEDLPPIFGFHNDIYASIEKGNYSEIKTLLLNKPEKTAQDYLGLSEIFGLEGNYTEKEKYLKLACGLDSSLSHCENILIKINGRVVDNRGIPLEGVEIKAISVSAQPSTVSLVDGSYELEFSTQTLQKNRLSISKQGYAPVFYGFTTVVQDRPEYQIPELVLMEGLVSFLVDNTNKTISGGGLYENGQFIVQSQYSKYYIPENALYLGNQIYSGKFYVYLYDFDRETVPESLTSLDVFSPVAGFVGTSMLTFGMPYINFQTEEGEVLHVKESNSMVLEYQSPIFLEEFPEKKEKNPYFIQDIDWVINLTRENPEVLTQEYIKEYNIPFPPFWVLDQQTGVWANVPFRVLNQDGLYKMKFYTTMK